MKRIVFTLLIILFANCSYAVEIIQYPENVIATVQPVQQNYKATDSILVQVTFTNSTEEEVTFLKWGTPFEGRINVDFFTIQLENGEVLPYVGRMLKRTEPTPGDYQTIAAGASINAVVNLLDGYDVNQKGTYSISYTSKWRNDSTEAVSRKTIPVTFTLTEDRPSVSYKQPPDFFSCSASQQAALDLAVTDAENMSNTAKNSLQNTPVGLRSGAERYVEWFGSYNASRWNTVQSNFTAIYNAVRNQTMEFDCGCNEPGVYAYVYTNAHYIINICPAYWGAPATGTDSKAGIVIHEVSHFTVVAGTDDHVYGQPGSRNLAITTPNLAIENADSYEYFAENNPPLSMPTSIPLNEALDNADFSWSTGGNAQFYGQSSVSHYGGDAAQSGDVGNSQYSYLRTTTATSGIITFTWRVSSENYSDFLQFRVNGAVKEQISGETSWQEKSFTVTGESTIEWRYTKDDSGSSGSDSGWVDEVSFEEKEIGGTTSIIPILLKGD